MIRKCETCYYDFLAIDIEPCLSCIECDNWDDKKMKSINEECTCLILPRNRAVCSLCDKFFINTLKK